MHIILAFAVHIELTTAAQLCIGAAGTESKGLLVTVLLAVFNQCSYSQNFFEHSFVTSSVQSGLPDFSEGSILFTGFSMDLAQPNDSAVLHAVACFYQHTSHMCVCVH